MAYSSSPTISPRQRRASRQTSGKASGRLLFIYLALSSLILLVGVYLGFSTVNPMYGGTVAGFLILVPVIWSRPALGAYLIVGGAMVFEAFPMKFPDSITDQSLFFRSLQSVGAPGFLIATGAEVLMGFTLVVVIVRRMAIGKRPLNFGPLFPAIAFYTIMVGYGLVYGVGTGGNWEFALWEARAQIYFFMVYIIIYNTIEEKRQLKRLLWVVLIAIAIKGMVGLWRFAVTLGGDLEKVTQLTKTTNSILSHEESYFFALFFLFGLILFLFRANRGQVGFIAAASIPVIISMMVNERRAGMLALFMGIAIAGFLAFYFDRSRRKMIVGSALIFALILPVYMASTWNMDGPIAQPTRAVKSLIAPDERDEGSNEYREIESLDVKYNIQMNPLLGRGFGKEIIFFIPLPDISTLFIFWDLIPHNTILWVWMRMGFFGFVAFWFMVGRGLTGSMLITKQLKDPYLKSVGVFTVIALVTWIFMGLVDMGLVDFRETILIGSLLGLISRLPVMEQMEANGRFDHRLNE